MVDPATDPTTAYSDMTLKRPYYLQCDPITTLIIYIIILKTTLIIYNFVFKTTLIIYIFVNFKLDNLRLP